jgi:hypothetical protein
MHGVLERRSAVETKTGNAQNDELHRQLIALLTRGEITRSRVHSDHLALRKCAGIEARGFTRVLVKPQANRVLGGDDSCAI